MDIAIPLSEGITALDAIGPYEVLSRLPGARVRFVAVTAGPYRTDNRQLTLVADEPLSAVPRPEIVMVPGGGGTRALLSPNPAPPRRGGDPEGSRGHDALDVARAPRRVQRPADAEARGGAGEGRHGGRRVV